MVGVAVSGSLLLPVGAASAAPLPPTTLYFHSASGTYRADNLADPTAVQTGRGPAGSTLTTAAPTKTTESTADYSGPQTSGGPTMPTFNLPASLAGGSVSTVCIDAYVTTNAPLLIASLNSRFVKPAATPGGTPYANTNITFEASRLGSDLGPQHVRGLVNAAVPGVLGSDWAFSVFTFVNYSGDFRLTYDSVEFPSSITLNPAPGSCGPIGETILGGTSPGVTPPTYTDFVLPNDVDRGDLYVGTAEYCAEPTLGVNWNNGRVMMICGPYTYRATFNDATSPATATFANATPPFPGHVSLDPILHVDPITGRVWDSQLLGASSETLYSDDDGETWNPTQGSGQPHGADHQTIGAGPMHADVDPLPISTYGRRSVYYCSQGVAAGFCAQSRDGGITYDPTVQTYSIAECGGLHGHVQVGPKGQVYLPNRDCGGQVAVSRSLDGNKTWTTHRLPGTLKQDGSSDPGLAVGSAGSLYLGFEGGDGRAMVSTSRDEGDSWSTPLDVGAPFGIRNTQFTTMIAGDDDRAAFAFLGTATPGDDQAAGFTGTWHLYISTTYDHGLTWSTVKANPTNIAQRGCVWLGGGDNVCRNMLDFMDVTVDRTGRVLVGWADGCTTAVCQGAAGTAADSRTDQGTITRQASGLGLFRSLDGFTPTDPEAVVPEVPFGALIPLAAVVVMGTAYRVTRRRHAAA